MTVGIVFATQPLALAAQAQITTALGYPKCARLTGTVIGTVPACLCTTGLPGGVDAGCPYRTYEETQVVPVNGGTAWALIVDGVMQLSPACLAAVPAIASASAIIQSGTGT